MISISIKDLKKSYGKHQVLTGLNLEIEKGTIFALLGSNGAGKTTLVRILSTLLHADSGEVTIHGFDLNKNAKAIRTVISLTGQYAGVDELLTGKENLHMMGAFSHIDSETVKKRTDELLEKLELQASADRPVKTYSGGMRRKLDLAISLLAQPPIIFLDEPTTGLDPRSRLEIWKMVKSLVKDGVTLFLTTQYLEEADQLADKIAVINNGRIVAEGTATELKNQIGGEMVELTFADKTAYEKAQKLLEKENFVKDETSRMIAIKTKGTPMEVNHILTTLTTKHSEPATLNLRKPTLDDVFMQLTRNKPKEEENK